MIYLTKFHFFRGVFILIFIFFFLLFCILCLASFGSWIDVLNKRHSYLLIYFVVLFVFLPGLFQVVYAFYCLVFVRDVFVNFIGFLSIFPVSFVHFVFSVFVVHSSSIFEAFYFCLLDCFCCLFFLFLFRRYCVLS